MTTLEQARRQFATIPEPAVDDVLDGRLTEELRKSGLDLGEDDEAEPFIRDGEKALRWKDIVLTGKLSQTRAKIKAQIIAHGGTIQSSVTHSTDFVVLGTLKRDESAKLDKARAYGISIISEDELRRLMKGE